MKLLSGIYAIWLLMSSVTMAKARNGPDQESLTALRKAVFSPAFWVKVHAIEFLADLGYHEEAKRYTDGQLASFEDVPQKRIGFWRCKYRLSTTENEQEKWLDKIKAAYLDSAGTDRIHAVETLAKLRFSLKNIDSATVERDLKSETDLAAFTFWAYSLPKQAGMKPDFEKLLLKLDQQNERFPKIIGYSLGFIPDFPEAKWEALAKRALKEPENSAAHAYLLGSAYTAYRSGKKSNLFPVIKEKLLALKDVQDKSARMELCRALAARPDKSDLPLLDDLMHSVKPLKAVSGGTQSDADVANEDVKAAAAYAILCIKKQHK